MTVLRKPDTVEDAVRIAAVLLGDDAIAKALTSRKLGVSVSPDLVRAWSIPERPQRPNIHQCLAIEEELLKAGHGPVFGELFVRLKFGIAPGDPGTALITAMQSTESATDLMRSVREGLQDGQFEPHEVSACKAKLSKLQKALGALNRSLVVKRK